MRSNKFMFVYEVSDICRTNQKIPMMKITNRKKQQHLKADLGTLVNHGILTRKVRAVTKLKVLV